MFYSETLRVKVKSQGFEDITSEIEDIIKRSKVKNGLVNVFCAGSTGSIVINENDPPLLKDIRDSLDKISPANNSYRHPSNAYSHIRATFLNSSQTIPVENNKLKLGTWQSVFIANFDISDRERNVVVTVSG